MRKGRDLEETAETTGALAPELTRYIGYLVRRVHARFATDPRQDNRRPRDFVVLAMLAEQDVHSQQALAERLGINRTIMVHLVERLEREGYVTRTRNPDNRRSYVLSLTEAGRRELGRMRRAVMARDRRLTRVLSAEERVRLNNLLRALLPERERVAGVSSTEFLVLQVHLHLRRLGDSMLTDMGLRMRHYGPLQAVERFGPCPQQQLARYLAIDEPAAAALVDELVQMGLVARGQDPADRRRYALTLTDVGRDRLGVVREAAERMQSQLTAILGPEGDAELRSLLSRLLPAGAESSPTAASGPNGKPA